MLAERVGRSLNEATTRGLPKRGGHIHLEHFAALADKSEDLGEWHESASVVALQDPSPKEGSCEIARLLPVGRRTSRQPTQVCQTDARRKFGRICVGVRHPSRLRPTPNCSRWGGPPRARGLSTRAAGALYQGGFGLGVNSVCTQSQSSPSPLEYQISASMLAGAGLPRPQAHIEGRLTIWSSIFCPWLRLKPQRSRRATCVYTTGVALSEMFAA